MKKLLLLSFLFTAISLSMSSCLKDDCQSTHRYVRYTPIFMSPEEARAQIEMQSPRELENPGKIYVYQHYLFINEIGKGIHIFDNSDFASPIEVGFLNIPGNYDIAIKDDFLYADNSRDILTFDVSNMHNPLLVSSNLDVYANNWNQDNDILLYYDRSEHVEEHSCEDFGTWYKRDEFIFFEDDRNLDFNVLANSAAESSGDTGIGGSFARFTISKNHLYVVDQRKLRSFDLQSPSHPNFVAEDDLGWNIETIFPKNDHLFIGSESGLFIYDITNPSLPVFIIEFEHARACDPVFVEDNTAYVTLRNGTECLGFVNQLDIIDISNLHAPRLIASHEMINPHGLSVRDGQVLLCEGTSGLKVIDASDQVDIDVLQHIKGFDAYDIISLNPNHFMLIGADGFYQYDFQLNEEPELLSHIAVKRN